MIDSELLSVRRKMAAAIQKRDFGKSSVYMQRIQELTLEKERFIEKEQFDFETKSQDKHLKAWAGKTLSLTINLCDVSLFLQDAFFEYFKFRGYEARHEWRVKYNALKKAAEEFRAFNMHFFTTMSDKNANSLVTAELIDLIEKWMYSDREMVHQKRFTE